MFEHFKKYPAVLDIIHYQVDGLDKIIEEILLERENKLISLKIS